MRQELTESEAIGHTIEGFVYSWTSKKMLIKLSGEAFVCFGIDNGYDRGDEAIVQEKLDVLSFGDEELIDGDIMSHEEITALMRRANRKADEAIKKAQREEYERL